MTSKFSMAAVHSKRPVGEDQIFKVNNEALQASKIFGKDKVTNASVGALLDDEGRLTVLPAVVDILRNLSPEDYSAYAPIAGLPDFLEAVKKAAFRDNMPSGYKEAIATPGGTGSIRHTIWNYSEYGDTVLTADWYWGPYKTIAEEHGRKLDTFKLFDEEFKFNISSFTEKVDEIVEKQKRIVILLNSPANNPTGYNLSDAEWDKLIEVLEAKAKDPEKRIILFVDIAYIDYTSENDNARKFMSGLGSLSQNILSVIAFSMSKGYTLYGMRSGAMICVTSNEDVAKEFRAVNEFSNRGVWSNGTRPAMVVLSKIFNDKLLYEKVENERKILRDMLFRRAQAFVEQAEKVNLKICPYKSGFFVSIPCENSKEVVDRLKINNIFAVPMAKGIRFAVCSVSEEKCAAAPLSIVKAMNL